MPTRFRPYQPKQMLMLPPDLREWVPEGHLAHQVSELVDGLELGAFYRPYEEDGRRNCPYEPRMMVKVLIYAYATGVFSSRKIAPEAGGGRGVSDAGGLGAATDDLRVSPPEHLKDFKKMFAQVDGNGAGDGDGGVFEGAGEREPAQGDELWTDEGARAATIDQLFGEEDERYGEDPCRRSCVGGRTAGR